MDLLRDILVILAAAATVAERVLSRREVCRDTAEGQRSRIRQRVEE
jgi:hypothetical protein